MAIRYEIDVPIRTPEGIQVPPLSLELTRNELDDEFVAVESLSIYRPSHRTSVLDEHQEFVRFSFDARDVPDTHEWVARWRNETARRRFGTNDVSVVWYHPIT